MAEKVETKSEALPDLDDLLQCPVCYEIPSGQIFQCNEGHHVCGRCKMRLDMCPVCRALFFGTRNYAMEELIANVRKLRAFKLGGKVTTGTIDATESAPSSTEATEPENVDNEEEEESPESSTQVALRPPPACKGLFRCLCCKTSNGERLPAARLLNHLRYFHAPELIEGQSENGEYIQAWQFSTVPGRIVTAVRISDMGIFFLIIEISDDTVCAWLSMAASPWVAHEYSYTVTISGNDREAIFSDCVWSVRSCEGSLKKRGHCLSVNGLDARALVAPVAIAGKLAVRRTPPEQLAQLPQPRAVLRVASRGAARDLVRDPARDAARASALVAAPHHDLEPFLVDLQNDVARLSRAFASLGREANALVRSEAEMRARIEAGPRAERAADAEPAPADVAAAAPPTAAAPGDGERQLSRNARRRMRQRLRAALDARPPAEPVPPPLQAAMSNGLDVHNLHLMSILASQPPVPPPVAPAGGSTSGAAGGPGRGRKKRRQRR